MEEGKVILTEGEFEEYIRDSEICRILRDVFSSMEDVPSEFVRKILDVKKGD